MAREEYRPYGLMEKELEEYRKYFWQQDVDGDGQLSKNEFNNMLRTMGLNLTRQEVENLFAKTDVDKNYRISFHEFAEAFIAKKREHVSGDRLRRVFQEADRDRDGYLTTDECLAALKQLGHVMDDKGIRRVMGLMDKNNDGMITFQEFCKFMA
ncbi:calmodulin-4-like isoform X3 [Clytia hemisphaerica]|uniref:EF-hand domain-containing protein n=1 Tax=Clytia hemisphaerica TaxID=252671 RepID=A0A7M5X3W4_9CNID